jgi:hypothetical protein
MLNGRAAFWFRLAQEQDESAKIEGPTTAPSASQQPQQQQQVQPKGGDNKG